MSILPGIYGIGVNHTRYRSKFKKIEAAFPDQQHFVTAKANTTEIVLNASDCREHKKKDILQHCSEQAKPS